MVVEEVLLLLEVVARVETPTVVAEGVRRALAVGVEVRHALEAEEVVVELLQFSGGEVEALTECLVLEEEVGRALGWVVEEVRQKARGCQQTVEARQTCHLRVFRRRLQASSEGVVEVEDPGLQHSTKLALCSVQLEASLQTCPLPQLVEVP